MTTGGGGLVGGQRRLVFECECPLELLYFFFFFLSSPECWRAAEAAGWWTPQQGMATATQAAPSAGKRRREGCAAAAATQTIYAARRLVSRRPVDQRATTRRPAARRPAARRPAAHRATTRRLVARRPFARRLAARRPTTCRPAACRPVTRSPIRGGGAYGGGAPRSSPRGCPAQCCDVLQILFNSLLAGHTSTYCTALISPPFAPKKPAAAAASVPPSDTQTHAYGPPSEAGVVDNPPRFQTAQTAPRPRRDPFFFWRE